VRDAGWEALLRRRGSTEFEAFHRLTGELRDELEVLVEMEHSEVRKFGDRCDQEVSNRRRSVLTTLCEHRLQFERPVFDPGRDVLDGIDEIGGSVNSTRWSAAVRAE
jgi:hypothetical protein